MARSRVISRKLTAMADIRNDDLREEVDDLLFRIDGVLFRAWESVLRLYELPAAEIRLKLLPRIAQPLARVDAMARLRLRRVLRDQYDSAFQAMVDLLPADYWRVLPVREEVEATATQRLIYSPPKAADVERILKEPFKGMTWEERLGRAARHLDPGPIAQQLVLGAAEGEGVDVIARRLRQRFDLYRSEARRLVRTEIQRVANRMALDGFEPFGSVIGGFQIRETLDDRTRPHHAARHGTVYVKPGSTLDGEPIDGMPELPDEPNCRGSYSPVLEPEFNIFADGPMTVASQDGPIEDPTTYDRWFRDQSEERKIKIVGRQRWGIMQRKLTEPTFLDFLDPRTLRFKPASSLRRESAEAYAQRRAELDRIIQRIEQAARAAFSPTVAKPPTGIPGVDSDAPPET